MTTHFAISRSLTAAALVVLGACSGDTGGIRHDVTGTVVWPEAGRPDWPPSPDGPRPGDAAKPREAGTKDGPALPADLGGPAPGCKPYCAKQSGLQSAWYDGCTKKILKLPGTNEPYYDTCLSCTAQCKFVGQPAEGWYSSCTSQLIMSFKCG
jgi:hypothetical protein